MYLRWKKRYRPYETGLRWDCHAGIHRRDATQMTAVLVKSVRVNGKPRQQYVATLGSIDAIWLARPDLAEKRYDREAIDQRIQFWRGIRSVLAQLVARGTITSDQHDTLKMQIAQTVPLPTEDDLELTSDVMREINALTPELDEAVVQQLLASVGGHP
jgi:hypothetical protein